MSDSTEGPGWWQASDGKWYPPDQHPDYQAAMPETPPTQAIPPTPPPTAPIPAVAPPVGGPPPGGPPPGAPGTSSNGKWIAIGAIAAVIIAIAAFLLLKGDDKKQNVSANSSASASSSSKSSSSSSSRSSSSSSKSTSSSSSSSLTAADVQQLLLTAADIGSDFHDTKFTADNTSPTPCGQPNTNTQVPPTVDVGSDAVNSTNNLFFQEEVSIYKDETTATHAFDLGKQGVSCTQGAATDGTPITFSAPKDVSSDFSGVDEAIEVDFQAQDFQGQLFGIRVAEGIVVFQFQGASSADTSQLPDPTTIVKAGLQKLGG